MTHIKKALFFSVMLSLSGISICSIVFRKNKAYDLPQQDIVAKGFSFGSSSGMRTYIAYIQELDRILEGDISTKVWQLIIFEYDNAKNVRIFESEKKITGFRLQNRGNYIELCCEGEKPLGYRFSDGKKMVTNSNNRNIEWIYGDDLHFKIHPEKTMLATIIKRKYIVIIYRDTKQIKHIYFSNGAIKHFDFAKKSNTIAVKGYRIKNPKIISTHIDQNRGFEKMISRLPTGDSIADKIMETEGLYKLTEFMYKKSACSAYVAVYLYKKNCLKIYNNDITKELNVINNIKLPTFDFLQSIYGTYFFYKYKDKQKKDISICLSLSPGDLGKSFSSLVFKKGMRYLLFKRQKSILMVFDLLEKKQLLIGQTEHMKKPVRKFYFFSHNNNDYLLIIFTDNTFKLRNLSKKRTEEVFAKRFNAKYFSMLLRNNTQHFLVDLKSGKLISAVSDAVSIDNPVQDRFVAKDGDVCFVKYKNGIKCFDMIKNKEFSDNMFQYIPHSNYALLYQDAIITGISEEQSIWQKQLRIYNVNNNFKIVDTYVATNLSSDYFFGNAGFCCLSGFYVVIKKDNEAFVKCVNTGKKLNIEIEQQSPHGRYRVYYFGNKQMFLIDTLEKKQININYSQSPIVCFDFFADNFAREYLLEKDIKDNWIIFDLQKQEVLKQKGAKEYTGIIEIQLESNKLMLIGKGTKNAFIIDLVGEFRIIEAERAYYLVIFNKQQEQAQLYRITHKNILLGSSSLDLEYLFSISSTHFPKVCLKGNYMVAGCRNHENCRVVKVYDMYNKTQIVTLQYTHPFFVRIDEHTNLILSSSDDSLLRDAHTIDPIILQEKHCMTMIHTNFENAIWYEPDVYRYLVQDIKKKQDILLVKSRKQIPPIKINKRSKEICIKLEDINMSGIKRPRSDLQRSEQDQYFFGLGVSESIDNKGNLIPLQPRKKKRKRSTRGSRRRK